jgi:putative ABC transport system ATP-binding protein
VAVTLLRGVNLWKSYGSGHAKVDALRGVSVEVKPGEVVLVIGPSGSGKTTLLSILGALARPDRGWVEIGGRRVSGLDQAHITEVRRRHVGFVFQNFQLLSALTARENVETALNLRGLRGRAARRRAEELLASLGLAERVRSFPDELSGGEKQRVALARALAGDPFIILGDEPTANLDAANGHRVIELLARLAAQRQKGVLLVSHDPRIRDVAHRVYEMEDGQIKRQRGPPLAFRRPAFGRPEKPA